MMLLQKFLLVLFKTYKFIVHLLTGRCELERICGDHQVSLRSIDMVDQSLATSSKLVTQRQLLLTATLSSDADTARVTQLADDITRFKKFRVPGVAIVFRRVYSCLFHANAAVNRLEVLRVVTFEDQEHGGANRARLLGLWKGLNPDQSEVPPLVSPLWKDIGFQGDNPATDFRGMGMLGLENLAHFATHHGEVARSVLLTSQDPTQWFPFAITGIQITKWLLDKAKAHRLHHYFCRGEVAGAQSTATVECFGEVYSATYASFHRFWISEGGRITEFPYVFERFQRSWGPVLEDMSKTADSLFSPP